VRYLCNRCREVAEHSGREAEVVGRSSGGRERSGREAEVVGVVERS
jgi:hypothetical protein